MASQTVTLNPSGYNTSHTSAGTISNISNAYTNSASTTYATISANTTSRTASSYISFTFDVSSIPSTATIDSVACYTKGAVSTTSTTRTSTFVAQLYNGTTAMGSSASIGAKTAATAANITSTGTWTRTALDNLELRFTHTRSNSTSNVSMYIYGADLVITYTEASVQYTVTISSSGPGTTTPTGTQTVTEGDSLNINVAADEEGTTISITDNGTDVSDHIIYTSDQSESSLVETSQEFTITGYTTSGSVSGTYYQGCVGQNSGSTSVTGNDYASNNNAYIYYTFDLSSIPTTATVTTVECVVMGHCESTSQTSEQCDVQLYAGTTAKGSASTLSSSTDNHAVTLTTGSWTRTELDSLKLQLTLGYYGGAIAGVTLKISYTTEGEATSTGYYILENVTTAHTIVVTYTAGVTYTVTTTITNGVLLSPTTESMSVSEGKSCKLTFSGNTGQEFKSMTVSGTAVDPTWIESSESKTYVTINSANTTASTNTTAYSGSVSDIIDGNASTYYWDKSTQAAGDYMMIALASAVTIETIQTTATFSSTDYPQSNCQLQISTDGSSWITAATYSDGSQTQTFTINQKCQYIRWYITSAANYWWGMNEVYITAYTETSVEAHYEYTIDSVTGDTAVAIIFGPEGPTLFVKNSGGTWTQARTIYQKTDSGWIRVSADDFRASASSGTYKFILSATPVVENIVGTFDTTTNAINFVDTLTSDTYTLKYEDSTNTPLEEWADIGTITI